MGNKYGYYINLDERGEFYADVRDIDSKSVFELRSTEEGLWTVDAGYMRHNKDIIGLQSYLRDVDMIEKDAMLLSMSDFERFKEQTLQYSDQDPLETLEANLGSLIRSKGTMLMGKGVFTCEDVVEVRDLLANRTEETAGEFVSSLSEPELQRVKDFMSNLSSAVLNREQVDIAGGEFNTRELTMLKIFLGAQLMLASEPKSQQAPRG